VVHGRIEKVELGGKSGVCNGDVPQWGSGAKPQQGVWGRSPPEAGAFKKIHNLNFKAL